MPHQTHDPDWETRPATESDLAWLLDIGNQTAWANGFTPRAAIADHIERDDYTILTLGGQHAAFMFTTGGRRAPFHIVQSAVSLELWRLGYGEILFSAVALRALARPVSATTCSVRHELPSNHFWTAIGAQHIDTTPGGKSRGKMLCHYAWTTIALHRHALHAATDPRHHIPERDTAATIIDAHGFLPCSIPPPRTPTSDAHHHAGITIPTTQQTPRRSTKIQRTQIQTLPTVPPIPE